MNVLFLTLHKFSSLDEGGIYTDLLRQFKNEGHHLYILSPLERRDKRATHVVQLDHVTILRVRTLNIQKSNVIEKGIGTLLIEHQFLKAVRRYLADVRFDLVLYATPPITFSNVISYIKRRDLAFAYLLLKDIFPQNAVDMKMIKKGGIAHSFFLKKERELYKLSDCIGCMSEANLNYLLTNNSFLSSEKAEVNPNSIEPKKLNLSVERKRELKHKYGIPENKKVFVYGGNLGKPQGLDFLLETITATVHLEAYYLIVGSGTELKRLQKWFARNKPKNAQLVSALPREEYNELLSVGHFGMIFLHQDFSIPNFPSRLLSYLENGMPVLAATDVNSDIGEVIEENECGFWVESTDIKQMIDQVTRLCKAELDYTTMSGNAWSLLVKQFHVRKSFQLIENRMMNVPQLH